MFSLVAVDQDRMIASIHNGDQSGCNLILRYLNKGLFVSRNAKLKEGDAVIVEELGILLGVFFEDQCAAGVHKRISLADLASFAYHISSHSQHALQAQCLEKGKMTLLRKAGSIDPRIDHSKVLWRYERCRWSRTWVGGRGPQDVMGGAIIFATTLQG